MPGASETFAAYHGDLALVAGGVGLAVGVAVRVIRRSAAPPPAVTVVPPLALAAVTATLVAGGQHLLPWAVAGPGVLVFVLLGSAARRADAPLVGLLAAISALGVYAAVPDTEIPAVVVGVLVAVVVVVGPAIPPVLGDRVAAVTLVGLAAVTGSAGRSEVVGGLACLGLLLAPLPSRLDRPALALAGLHTAVVVVAARVVTRWSWIESIAASAVLLWGALAVAVRWRSARSGGGADDA